MPIPTITLCLLHEEESPLDGVFYSNDAWLNQTLETILSAQLRGQMYTLTRRAISYFSSQNSKMPYCPTGLLQAWNNSLLPRNTTGKQA